MADHIRPATDADRKTIGEIYAAAILDGAASHFPPAALAAWAARPPLNDPAFGVDTLVLVADREGIVVGYGEADLAAGTVERLFVRPAVMGTGVGSALLARLETAVADRGHRRVSLDAADNALPFYERHGYARTGRSDRRDCGDVTLTCIGLAKTFLALMSILGGWAGPAH